MIHNVTLNRCSKLVNSIINAIRVSCKFCKNSITAGSIFQPERSSNSFRTRMAYGYGATSTSTISDIRPDWNQSLIDAQAVVGNVNMSFILKCLLSDEISNVALNLRKLVGTNHPLLETAKRLKYTGHNVMQTRGLIVLLMSKAAGHPLSSEDYIDAKTSAGISQRQRSLAEMTELIHSAFLIHRSLVDLEPAMMQDPKVQDLHFGNKMSVLSGDYLLAAVMRGLGEIRNTHVVELMARAISDFMEGQFRGQEENPTSKYWEEKNFMTVGSLQANSCQSALALANHLDPNQEKAYEFGKNFALAWQAFNEMQPFLSAYNQPTNTVATFDPMTAPVMLHFEATGLTLGAFQIEDEKLREDAKPLIDYKKLHQVVSSGIGMEKTEQLIQDYTNNALHALDSFAPSESVHALSNIVYAIGDVR